MDGTHAAAASAGWRDHVVTPIEEKSDEAETPAGATTAATSCFHEPRRPKASSRIAWAQLLRRVFAGDALLCPRCGGRMRIMAAIRCQQSVVAFLDCVGLPARSSPLAPARRESLGEFA